MGVLLASRLWLCNAGVWTTVVDVTVGSTTTTAANVDDASRNDDSGVDEAREVWTVLDDNTGVPGVNDRSVEIGDWANLDVVSGRVVVAANGVVDGGKELLSINGGELEISWNSFDRLVGHSFSSGTA